jgi:DNA-directed RNA polymerase subunit L
MFEISSSSAPHLRFTVRNVNMQIVNSLRRTILSEVENVAFRWEDVHIMRNTSPLHDDIMAKRVAMVPIKLALGEVTAYVPGSVTATLSMKNSKMVPVDVTTADMVLKLHGVDYPHQSHALPRCEITGDHILLTRLQPGQEISFNAVSSKGTPLMHACYASVSVASYGLEIDDTAVAAKRAGLVANEAGLDAVALRATLNHFDCLETQRTYKVAGDGFTPLGYKFVVESESGMMAHEIVEMAFNVLERKFVNPDIEITALRDDPSHLQFTISGEGDTMASVLQSITLDSADALDIVSAGYHIPHPLERTAVFRVKFAHVPEDPMTVLREMLGECKSMVSGLREGFVKAHEVW